MGIIKLKILTSEIIKKFIDNINSRLDNVEGRIGEFNNKSIKII